MKRLSLFFIAAVVSITGIIFAMFGIPIILCGLLFPVDHMTFYDVVHIACGFSLIAGITGGIWMTLYEMFLDTDVIDFEVTEDTQISRGIDREV